MIKWWMIALALLALFGCEESLPPYVEPVNVLDGSIERLSPDTLRVYYASDGEYLGSDLLRVNVKIANAYPQLLQGSVLVKGRVNVYVVAPVPIVGVPVVLARQNLAQPPIFQEAIALPPGQAAQLRAEWYPFDARGGFVFSSVPHVETVMPDSTVVRTYLPMTFRVEADVQIFERVPSVRTRTLEFVQQYIEVIVKAQQ